MEVVIKKGRKIEIPEAAMRKLGLKVGEKVIIKEKNYSLEIAPAKSAADELRGSIKGDKKRIGELIEAEVWEFQ